MPDKKTVFLKNIHYFRGIAIIFVVMAHCTSISGIGNEGFIERLITNLISGGTVLFVFIAGFLFQHIYARRFKYKFYLHKKLERVLIPYVILGLPGIYYWVIYKDAGFHLDIVGSNPSLAYLFYFLTGSSMTAYWFVPFIYTIYIISPLLLTFMRWSTKTKLILIALGLIVSGLISRPVANINTIQSVLYFLPVYMIGALSAQNYDRLKYYLRKYDWVLFLSALMVGVIDAKWGNGIIHKPAFEFGGIDLILFQKLILTFGLIGFMQRVAKYNIPVLTRLADISFPIFFIHPQLIFASGIFLGDNKMWANPGAGLFLANLLILLAASSVIAYSIKYIFKNRSKFIIGY
jgi:probable poly-beta-1,6-N-acetyl-D-glucosamine export protein